MAININESVETFKTGQQVKIKLAAKKNLPERFEKDDPRFVILGKTTDTPQKLILVLARSAKDLQQKYKTIFPTDELENMVEWKSKTPKTSWIWPNRNPHFLDFNDIYLLDLETENITKYDDTFSTKVSSLNFYNKFEEQSYKFNSVELRSYLLKVKNKLRTNGTKKIELASDDSISLIKKAEQIGVTDDYRKRKNSMVVSKEINQFLTKLGDFKKVITIPIFYENDNDDILTPELLQTLISTEHLLEILCQETASVFEKNYLKQLESKVIDVEIDSNNICHAKIVIINKNNKKQLTKVKLLLNLVIKSHVPLIHSLFSVSLVNAYLRMLIVTVRNDESQINKQIERTLAEIKFDKELFLEIIDDEENVSEKEILIRNKQSISESIMWKIICVNHVQKIKYYEVKLLQKIKDFLIAANNFVAINKLNITFKQMEAIAVNELNGKTESTDPNLSKVYQILNGYFTEIVKIYDLCPNDFKHRYGDIYKILLFLNELKKMEINKIFPGSFNINFDLLKSRNLEDFKTFSSENSKALDELMSKYLDNAKTNNFDLEEQIIVAEQFIKNEDKLQITEVTVDDNDYLLIDNNKSEVSRLTGKEAVLLKFNKIINQLKDNQAQKDNLVVEMNSMFKEIEENKKQIEEQKRICEANLKVGEIVEAYITSVSSKPIKFRVLENWGNNNFIIFYNATQKGKPHYKIRMVNKIDLNILPNLVINDNDLPQLSHISNFQAVINEYVETAIPHSQIPLIAKNVNETLNKTNQVIYFSDFNAWNISDTWEWKANIAKIKQKIVTELQGEDIFKSKEVDIKFTLESKQKILKARKSDKTLQLQFDIFVKTDSDKLVYKMTSDKIKFKINRGSYLAKKYLKKINIEVKTIKKHVNIVKVKQQTVLANLKKLIRDINEFLIFKQEELAKISNHYSLKFHQKNNEILLKLETEIKFLNEQINECINFFNNNIFLLEDNVNFYNNFIKFISHYQNATEVTPSENEKYLFWEHNYIHIQNQLLQHTTAYNFAQYRLNSIYSLEKIDKTITKYNKKLTHFKSDKFKFKKLTFWRKIWNYISWTWKSTKNKISNIKNKNDCIFVISKEKNAEQLVNVKILSSNLKRKTVIAQDLAATNKLTIDEKMFDYDSIDQQNYNNELIYAASAQQSSSSFLLEYKENATAKSAVIIKKTEKLTMDLTDDDSVSSTTSRDSVFYEEKVSADIVKSPIETIDEYGENNPFTKDLLKEDIMNNKNSPSTKNPLHKLLKL